MQYPEFYILRHGETEWNAVGRWQGRLNSPLTPRGLAHAADQQKILSQCNLVGFQFFSSPQGRAFHTAAIAFAGIADRIVTDDRLQEIAVGVLEGQYRAEFLGGEKPELDEIYRKYDQAEGGEGMAGLEERCRSFLDSLTAPAVITCHGITSAMIRCIAMGIDTRSLLEMPGGQGIVYRIKAGQSKLLSLD